MQSVFFISKLVFNSLKQNKNENSCLPELTTFLTDEMACLENLFDFRFE